MPTAASWYSVSVYPVSRLGENGRARSAVGIAAYVTGENLKIEDGSDRWAKRNHPGDVLAWGMTAPGYAPAWVTTPANLQKVWNQVEKSETRINSHLANHTVIALHRDWTVEQQQAAMKEIATRYADRYGVVVTWAVHAATGHGDERNAHGHIATSMRRIQSDGKMGKKVRELSDRKTSRSELNWQRQMVEQVLNKHLERSGSDERVSSASYKDQGIDKEPMVHLGNAQNQAELKGAKTPRGELNRAIKARNAMREELAALKREHAQLTAEIAATETTSKIQPEPTAGKIAAVAIEGADDVGGLQEIEQQRIKQIEAAEERAEFAKVQAEKDAARKIEMADTDLLILKSVKDRAQAEQEQFAKLEQEDKQRKKEAAEKAHLRESANVDLNDGRLRYADALHVYDIRRPYSTLATAAAIEGTTFAKQQQVYRQREANETDPEKRRIITLARQIEAADYLAQTHDRVGRMAGIIQGNLQSTEAIKHKEWSQDMREVAAQLREERAEAKARVYGRGTEQIEPRISVVAKAPARDGFDQVEVPHQTEDLLPVGAIERMKVKQAARDANRPVREEPRGHGGQLGAVPTGSPTHNMTAKERSEAALKVKQAEQIDASNRAMMGNPAQPSNQPGDKQPTGNDQGKPKRLTTAERAERLANLQRETALDYQRGRGRTNDRENGR